MVAAELQHLGADEALDQAEHVGVGAALHLAEEATLPVREERQLAQLGKPVGQKLLARSKLRPRKTSRSMSQRTRLDVSVHCS